MNIEVNLDTMYKLRIDFKLNLSILRFICIRKNKPVVSTSFMNINNK